MPFIEDYREFCERHGEHVIYRLGGMKRVVFLNGALATQDTMGNVSVCEPPEHARGLLKMQHEFWSVKLQHARRELNGITQYIQTQIQWHRINAGPAPEDEAFDSLKKQRRDVLKLQAKVLALDNKLKEGKPRITVHDKAAERHASADDANRRLHAVLNGAE